MKCPGAMLCGLVIATGLFCWCASLLISHVARLFLDDTSDTSWILRFLFTILGYATIFLPCFVLIHLSKKHNLHSQSGWHWVLLRLLLTGNVSQSSDSEQLLYNPVKPNPSETRTLFQKAKALVYCCTGLQISYLVWGVLQEKIMTKDYVDGETIEKFTDSQFLVFVNRILAFAFSGIYLLVSQQNTHRTPLYKYSYCSVSNTLSSWCQYEALKFVSFPTQVLAKSAKVIPVMLMGKCVSRTQYKNYEYATALLISVGMTAFLLGSSDAKKGSTVTTVSGVVLLLGYLIFDSFTANWQSALFKEHRPSSVQMMCGVNLMSCIFTSASLIQQGGFLYSLTFAARHPQFIVDCLLTAVCSASGQLFIFATIAQFGAVVFTIIMTVRQGLSILLSCLLYNHEITAVGIFGIFNVFLAIFLRIYYGQKDNKRKIIISADSSVSKV